VSVRGQTGLCAARDIERLSLRRLPMILMYHAIADSKDDPNKLCVPPSVFADQMSWLASHGLRGVSMATLVDALRTGSDRGMVGITFDDGYVDVLQAAVPELRRHGFGATAFIISDRLGGTNEWDEGPGWPLLTTEGVLRLVEAGIEIGSHGATHYRLAGADPSRLATEVSTSQTRLSALTGEPIRGFAYPYGSMDAAARQAVRDAGYEYACAVRASVADIGLMALPRVYVGRQDRAARMSAKRFLYKAYIALKGRYA